MGRKSESSGIRLFLISSSMSHGGEYLAHCEDGLKNFLRATKEVLFIPFALSAWDEYERIARQKFDSIPCKLRSIHGKLSEAGRSLENAEAVFVGGGNTFALVAQLEKLKLMELLRARIVDGMPYIGSSAGANIAGKTIKATNDMPVVQVSRLVALDVLPFTINPHYSDIGVKTKQTGESRDERLFELLNNYDSTPIVALYEESYLEVFDRQVHVCGKRGVRVFQFNREPVDVQVGNTLDGLFD